MLYGLGRLDTLVAPFSYEENYSWERRAPQVTNWVPQLPHLPFSCCAVMSMMPTAAVAPKSHSPHRGHCSLHFHMPTHTVLTITPH